MDYLVEAVCNPAFKPWEVRDLVYRLDADAEVRLPCQVAEDLLNKAAFREGLGNSLFAPDYMVSYLLELCASQICKGVCVCVYPCPNYDNLRQVVS